MAFHRSILLAAGAVFLAGAAQADLKFCNETEFVQGVSIGYKGDVDWTSEGWWNVDPGACLTPVSGDLKHRYYYYRAEVDGGDFDGEGYTFCTSPKEYTIVGDTDCESRGYVLEDFAEIDTGETSTDFTFTLIAASDDPMVEDTPTEDVGFRVCNETADTQSVSIGYKGEEDWTTEGWWNIDTGDCSTLLSGELQKRYYYLRAEVDGGDFDGDGYFFCTTPKEYTIVGDSDCDARGYESEDFIEVDTGSTAKGYTYTFGTGDATVPSGDATGAGLTICNETDYVQGVSIGYEGSEDWTSEGWWNIDPGDCTEPALDAQPHRYFYYRAEINGGDFDGQGYFFCTSPQEYTIVGDSDCEAQGYEREDFAEIDTGGVEGMFTFTLISGADLPDDTPAPEPTPEPTPAGAGLTICNQTEYAQGVSIGYQGSEDWTSEGWWNIEPGDCTDPAVDGQQHRYFYYRAEIDGGDFDGEGYFFCTSPDEYTIVGDSDCEARGYEREDFAEIFTGDTQGTFTFTLVSGLPSPDVAPVPEPTPTPTPTPGFDFGNDSVNPESGATPDPVPMPDKNYTPRHGGSRG